MFMKLTPLSRKSIHMSGSSDLLLSGSHTTKLTNSIIKTFMEYYTNCDDIVIDKNIRKLCIQLFTSN
jgi:translation initiation factor 2 beta subunit (eIF-2beta)/eIF-5